MAEPLPPKPALSAKAQEDLQWLRTTLSERRVGGPFVIEGGDYEVELTRSDGRKIWLFAKTPEAALSEARKQVERTIRESRHRIE